MKENVFASCETKVKKLRRERMRLQGFEGFCSKGDCLSLKLANDFSITVGIPTTLLSILNGGSI
uniref:Putative ovule protein n=1 Tax=Solanum chacoense TaxID=4108 RepID=A0A0V0GZL2_SOLCH